MKIKQHSSWWIDTILFTGFIAAFFQSFTGIGLHQWLGVVIGGVVAAYHLLAHWDWVSAVSKRFWAGASGTVQLKFVTDGILLGGFGLIIGTGLVISTWLELSLGNYAGWLLVHILASITTLLTLLVKLALHWRWISRTARAAFSPPAPPSGRSRQLQPVPLKSRAMDCRDFLKVMRMAGGTSLVAMLSATTSLAALQATGASSAGQVESGNFSATDILSAGISQSAATNFSSGSTYSIQCGKRYFYPGQCRRYTDTDHNDRCDFGECA